MTLLDDMKASLRVSSDKFDAEVQMYIDGALYDMERVGVNPDLLALEDENISNAFVKHAVTAYCKAHFGFDNAEAGRLDDSYRRIVCDLLNSSQNIAAMKEASDGLEETAGQDGEPLDDVQQDGE